MNLAKPRLLIVATTPCRTEDEFQAALSEVGFDLVSLQGAGPKFQRDVARAIGDLAPDMILPADQPAIELLGTLPIGPAGGHAATMIERAVADSLGDPAHRALLADKAQLSRFCRRHALPVAHAVDVADEAALRVLLGSVPLPVTLGGAIVRDVEGGVAAYSRLTLSASPVRRWFEGAVERLALSPPRRRAVAVQQYIDGVHAQRAVMCRQGRVLAGVSLEKRRAPLELGAAQAGRRVDHRTMTQIVSYIVAKLGVSGVVGFDFVMERNTRRAMLVGTSPVNLTRRDYLLFAAALHATIAGAAARAKAAA